MILTAALGAALLSGAAVAQSAVEPAITPAQPHSPWRTIDPAHEDLDLHARSLRRVEPGLAVFPHHYRVQVHEGAQPGLPTAQDPDTGLLIPQRYRYVMPGVEIRMGRAPDYLVQRSWGLALNSAPGRDGQYRTLIPSDSVYVLTPTRPTLPAPVPSAYRDSLQLSLQRRTLESAGEPMDGRPQALPVPDHYTQSVPSPLARRSSPAPEPSDAKPGAAAKDATEPDAAP
jgi:hypothetical protein